MALRLNIILCTLVALLLTGCYEESIESLSVVNEMDGLTSSYIKLSFSQATSNGTRANPTGGELGDGTEKGQTYENAVSSAALFLYVGNENTNINTTASDTRVTMVEFNNFTEATYPEQAYDYIAVSEPRVVDLDNGTYRVLAIANPKNLEWAREKGNSLTLGDVRDHIETEAWTESNGTYSSFLMTSENDTKGSIIYLDNNSYDDPATTFVEVERMAARVDYQAEGSYTIIQDEDNTVPDAYVGATVTITGAAIVNNLTAGSYELKRTNEGIGSAVTYLGDEEVDANGMPTNYVIDPWTEEKNGADEVTIDGVKSDISELYGVYYPGMAMSGDEQNPKYWEDLVNGGTPITDSDGSVWNRIGYTMENTTYDTYTNKKYNTGAVFAATFTPAEGTVRDSFYADYGFSYGYTNHATFFKWNEVLYATAEDMMAVAYPNVFTIENMFDASTFAEITDMDGLSEFIETLRDDDPTGYKAYLETFTELPTNMNTLYWVNYMENECGYKFDTTNGVTLNAFDVETTYDSTRAALAAYTDEEVSTYENAQCYYTWWIRHSNDDSDETNGLMEYAIVRNNIYKLQVTSVYSIGGDIPREGLRIHVYVKDWTMYATETVDL